MTDRPMSDSRLEVLDIALGNLERTYTSFRAFRGLVADIADFGVEAQRAKADAAAAQISLTDLNQQVAAAQAQLENLRAERDAIEQQVAAALTAERDEMQAAVDRIKAMVRAA